MNSEVITIIGLGLTIGTLIAKFSSSHSARLAKLEQQITHLEKTYEIAQDNHNRALENLSEKMDRIISRGASGR